MRLETREALEALFNAATKIYESNDKIESNNVVSDADGEWLAQDEIGDI